MIFHSVRRVGFHLYMAVSTLQLTSLRNLSEYWQLLRGHTSRCRSIFGFHILLSDTAVESCVTFKPRKAPIQLIQFSRFNNQKFCKYTFLYLFRFNAIISPVTANVNCELPKINPLNAGFHPNNYAKFTCPACLQAYSVLFCSSSDVSPEVINARISS